MAALRTVAAAMAAVALVGRVQANEHPLPPCLDPFQPFVYSGCFQQNDNTQILPYRSSSPSDNMTVEECVAECKGNGYRYAGLVYFGVCYCGQTVNGPQVSDDQCNLSCSGNSSEICGGNNIFSIYQDPTFPPADDVTIADYHSLGCWTDDSSLGRALVYRQDQLDSASLTTEKCLQACRDGEFPFAGTEYSGECYCGVVIGNDTYAAPASDCNMPCNGNSSETCGGSARLSLYVAHELQSLQPCGYEPPPVSSSTTLPPTTSTTSTSSSTSSTTTTTSKTSTTTTSSSACVSTTVVPPTCEYKCGKWCSNPLPDWDDVDGCKLSWSNCALQVASCFKHAGFPDALSCFEFGDWCADVSKYCNSKPSGGCRKTDFCGRNPPKGGNPPTTVTVTTTCKPTTTTKHTTTAKPTHTTSSTTKCPVPTPTNICTQPSNARYGYGPGKPVGGIDMPVVTCNDLAEDWPAYPFKQYNFPDSRDCAKYPRNRCGNACADACKEQYEDCLDVYAQGCKTKTKKTRTTWPGRPRDTSSSYRRAYAGSSPAEKRTFFSSWSDSYDSAVQKCKAQYSDCLAVNRGVTGAGKCPRFGSW